MVLLSTADTMSLSSEVTLPLCHKAYKIWLQLYLQIKQNTESRSFNTVNYSTIASHWMYKCLRVTVAESGTIFSISDA